MKHITLLPILILWANLIFSQNYRPFQANTTYTFQWSGENELFILKTDSTYIQGLDTIYSFNRIVRDRMVGEPPFSTNIIKTDQDNLFGKAMVEQPGGIYEFISSQEDTFVIQVNAPLNQAWVFNRKDSTTAQIAARMEMVFAGIRDSVIQIHLSNQDTLLISKNYGLIKTTAFLPFDHLDVSKDKLNIWNIEELNLGPKLAQLQDLFEVEAGENFFYHSRLTHFAAIGTYIWQRCLAPPLFPTPDSVVIKFERDRVDLTFLDVFEYLGRDTIEITQHARNFYPQLLSNQINQNMQVLRGPFLSRSFNNRQFYKLDQYSHDDTLLVSSRFEVGYGEGLGYMFTSDFSHTQEGLGDIYSLTTMNCYEKLTDSAGVCADTATYLALDPFLESAQLNAYPNPAKDHLEIDWEYLPPGKLELYLLDQTGRSIQSKWIDTRLQNRISLHIEALPEGLYFLTFIWKGRKSGALKIIVQK